MRLTKDQVGRFNILVNESFVNKVFFFDVLSGLIGEWYEQAERIKELEAENGIYLKASVDNGTKANELRALIVKKDAGLEEAIDLIVSEYCSHSSPCGANVKSCYASKIYAALDLKEKQ